MYHLEAESGVVFNVYNAGLWKTRDLRSQIRRSQWNVADEILNVKCDDFKSECGALRERMPFCDIWSMRLA
jgi:hypothetical protein